MVTNSVTLMASRLRTIEVVWSGPEAEEPIVLKTGQIPTGNACTVQERHSLLVTHLPPASRGRVPHGGEAQRSRSQPSRTSAAPADLGHPAMSSYPATKDGAFMEPSGRNPWQSLANGTASKTAQTS